MLELLKKTQGVYMSYSSTYCFSYLKQYFFVVFPERYIHSLTDRYIDGTYPIFKLKFSTHLLLVIKRLARTQSNLTGEN